MTEPNIQQKLFYKTSKLRACVLLRSHLPRFLSVKTHGFRKSFKPTSTTSSFNMSRGEQKNTDEKHTLEDLSIVWKELNLEDMEKA